MILVTAGCSFLTGLELDDPSRSYNIQLANYLGYEVHNISENGSSNEIIARRIVSYCHQMMRLGHTPDEIKVLCAWSVWTRHMQYDARQNRFCFVSAFHPEEKILAKTNGNLHLAVVKLSHGLELAYYEYAYNRILLEGYLKAQGIEYIMTHARRCPRVDMKPKNVNTSFLTTGLHELFDETKVVQPDFLEFTEQHRYPKGQIFHPLEQAHDEYTKVLLKFIEKNKIFT